MRCLSGGESHGDCLTAIIEGFPAGLRITSEYIDNQLRRRQRGYGRGGRMKLESDTVKILSGLRFNETIGSPLTLSIKNRDAENWKEIMPPEGEKPADIPQVSSPRPGHADYAGALKYLRTDFRDILERSSARETAIRVAAGSVARLLLLELGINIFSHVISLGKIKSEMFEEPGKSIEDIFQPEIYEKIEASPVRCASSLAESAMTDEIDKARDAGDTLGGVFEVVATGVPPGLGSYVQWDRRLDGKLAGAMMSLQGIKAVEIGLGKQCAYLSGSDVHDAFKSSSSGRVYRPTNRAGGIEGGITNGEPLIIRAAMKPIPTLMKPLPSVDLLTGKESLANVERSDVCAVPAASVVGEAIVSWELATAIKDKFSCDNMEELKESLTAYMKKISFYQNPPRKV